MINKDYIEYINLIKNIDISPYQSNRSINLFIQDGGRELAYDDKQKKKNKGIYRVKYEDKKDLDKKGNPKIKFNYFILLIIDQ